MCDMDYSRRWMGSGGVFNRSAGWPGKRTAPLVKSQIRATRSLPAPSISKPPKNSGANGPTF